MSFRKTIDPKQLSKIEGVHRGFLYQHLYAVACLLSIRGDEGSVLLTEHDEDVEIRDSTGSSWIYVQVKTREAASLYVSDVEGLIERVEKLHALHTTGKRNGRAEFVLVANKPASKSLLTHLSTCSAAIRYYSPLSTTSHGILPVPWRTLDDGFQACVAMASEVQHTVLTPQTLVWRLASFVAYVAAGRGGGGSHEIAVDSLPDLLEQFVAQLHRLIDPPEVLREMRSSFSADVDGIRILKGLPGCGKTTWAGEVVRHAPRPTTYVDAAQAPTHGLAVATARELLATHSPTGGKLASQTLSSSHSGQESLAVISQAILARDSQKPMVLVDNAHQDGAAEEILRAIQTIRDIDWLILGHPGDNLALIEDSLDCDAQDLGGWTVDSIAAAMTDDGCKFVPGDVDRVSRMTEGNPLFVKSICQLAHSDHSGSITLTLDELESGTHLKVTNHERILGKVARSLSDVARKMLGLLGIVDLALPEKVVIDSCSHLGVSEKKIVRGVRELREWSILEGSAGLGFRIRDAYRVVSILEMDNMSAGVIKGFSEQIGEWAFAEVMAGRSRIRSLLLHIRMLAISGDIQRLVGISTSEDELFIELGMMPEVKSILEGLNPEQIDPKSGFFASDTLAYWFIGEGNFEAATREVEKMKRYAEEHEFGSRDLGSLSLKELLIKGHTGDWEGCHSIGLNMLTTLNPEDDEIRGTILHNIGVMALINDRLSVAKEYGEKAVSTYLKITGLRRSDFHFVNNQKIMATLNALSPDSANVKRLADSLDLLHQARVKQGDDSGILDGIQAHKLYAMSGAHLSAIRVGKDVVDAMIAVGDAEQAEDLLRKAMIPLAAQYGFADELLHLRAQTAVVAAYRGRHAYARAELGDILRSYSGGLSSERTMEIQNQINLVERIASGQVVLGRQGSPRPLKQQRSRAERRRNRRPNEPCFCGSGVKYKRCHGKKK